MIAITTIFLDVGGVLLTNAWDTTARKRAATAFGLDYSEFQTRHEMLKTAFETGRLSLDAYIQKTVFHKPRGFTTEQFRQFMYEQSEPIPTSLDFVRRLAESGKYRLFSLNNESRELHEHRVRAFGLGELFDGFLCSCYLGIAKPDEDIYTNALGIAHCGREQAVFVDDRSLNVEPAIALGLNAILYEGLDRLRESLARLGVAVDD
jgi:putative hydrolase of the HAD superfamily